MKTAASEKPNRWDKVSRDRAHGAAGQNTSCSFKWAAKQENSSRGGALSLDFPFYRTLLMPKEPIRAPHGVNVPGFPMAGFQLTLHGRIWVTPEGAAAGEPNKGA